MRAALCTVTGLAAPLDSLICYFIQSEKTTLINQFSRPLTTCKMDKLPTHIPDVHSQLEGMKIKCKVWCQGNTAPRRGEQVMRTSSLFFLLLLLCLFLLFLLLFLVGERGTRRVGVGCSFQFNLK